MKTKLKFYRVCKCGDVYFAHRHYRKRGPLRTECSLCKTCKRFRFRKIWWQRIPVEDNSGTLQVQVKPPIERPNEMAASTPSGILSNGWWYNSNTGSVIDAPTGEGLVAKLGIGWHGPFPTQEAALNFYTQNAPHNPGWKAPTGLAGNIANASGVGGVITGVNAIGDFAQRLTQAHTWVRVGEFAAGAILIGVALNHLLGNPAGSVAKSAAKFPIIPIQELDQTKCERNPSVSRNARIH